ncbi:outer membrane beta-barrel protein [Campylobacter sp. MIT 97-5078]|uniref:outer membrane beta-barrel protein n=1 Tax=Campylobacter sp. MIT 97-5078 TaxID=1548153 RepID=UPI00068C4B20|nr:outer membrane beta-barrel protein [Campylobacter sp. MIT 97-5078]TQR28189.1 outer membrane beta-barrel protein [Campylobacter sp. MIT 97-5078]
MKKIFTSVAVASALLASAAVAEDSGAFVGANVAYGAAKPNSGGSHTGFRYGIIAGYKDFFNADFGVRYYGTFDLGTKYTKGSNNPQIETMNLYVNADALYNFAQEGDLEYGVFGGVGLGYVSHEVKNKRRGNDKPDGFDVALNLGLRTTYNYVHGFELFTRFGLLNQEATANGITSKVKQPYQVGLRYTFSF